MKIMKKHIFYLLMVCIVCSKIHFAQNIDLAGQLNPYPGLDYADVWGYAAPDGREYALMGVTGGTVIIDISDPSNPVEVEFIIGPNAPPYEWRDIKTHLNYAYIVTEGSGLGSGMQIVDLSSLPNSASLVKTFKSTFTTSHNIYIDNGYAYVVGTSGGGGMHILDLSDPVNPVQTAYYGGSGYIHDVYVLDDTAYVSGADTYDLVDVSDKSNPQRISQSAALPGIYAHSGWLTTDKRYFYATDEFNQRDLMVWDLQDRTTWELIVPNWQMPGNSAIHNVFIKDDYAHISYYADGYVVLDISSPTNPTFAGQYDTYTGTGGSYTGAWGVYPYLPSGYIIVSDMVTGLYVLKFDTPTSVKNENLPLLFSLKQNYPNPFNPSTNIEFTLPESGMVTLKVFNIIGEEVAVLLIEFMEAGSRTINFSAIGLPAGIYFARLTSGDYHRMIKMNLLK
jgi:choice-of-anchor B domain-containing protein